MMVDTAQKQIADEIKNYSNGNDRFGELLSYCIGRLCLKSAKTNNDWRKELSSIDVPHIADWLKAAIINDADWLKNVDEKNRPKKLMKFGSFKDIQKEADKAMLRANQRNKDIKLIDGDEELYMQLEDGYHLVKLLTPAALDREGAKMQHCIGGGAYDTGLKDDYYKFLSLRDKNGKSHATLEIQGIALVQLQGKQNLLPVKEYKDALKPLFLKSKITVDAPAMVLGYVISGNGETYDLDSLPDNLVINGDLDLTESSIKSLPDGIEIFGDLDISGTEIETLPENIKIHGSLYARSSSIKELPKALHLGGSLDLESSNIEFLPEILSVGMDMDINDAKISLLPDNLEVGGDFYLAGSAVKQLPKNLKVTGDLDLRCTDISALPDDLKVGGVTYIDRKNDIDVSSNININNIMLY